MSTILNSVGTIAPVWNSPRELLGRLGVISLICLSVTTPGIYFTEDLPWVKSEQALLPILVAVYILFLLVGYVPAIRPNWVVFAGAVFSISILCSMWYGSTVLGHQLLVRDFYEIPKIWYPVVFFTFAFEARLSEKALRRLIGWFCVAMLLVCLYAWAQWFSVGVSFSLNHYFSGGEHIDGALLRYRRVYSTMGNPNLLGQLLTWAIITFAMAAIARIGHRLVYISAGLACCLTLAMTGSRYGLLTTILGLFLVFLIPSARRRRVAQLMAVVLLLPLFYWTFNSIVTSNKFTRERYTSLSNPLEVDSLRERLDVLWRDAEDDFARSPFLGHGPAKTIYTGVITDSEYLDILKEFGLVGFVPYLAYYIILALMLLAGLRASSLFRETLDERMPATYLVARLSVIMVIMALVMNIGENTLHNQELQGFLWLWLGTGARAAATLADTTKGVGALARWSSRPDRAAGALSRV